VVSRYQKDDGQDDVHEERDGRAGVEVLSAGRQLAERRIELPTAPRTSV
jgi:hypothetical protein